MEADDGNLTLERRRKYYLYCMDSSNWGPDLLLILVAIIVLIKTHNTNELRVILCSNKYTQPCCQGIPQNVVERQGASMEHRHQSVTGASQAMHLK